jgi:hypothetical protein
LFYLLLLQLLLLLLDVYSNLVSSCLSNLVPLCSHLSCCLRYWLWTLFLKLLLLLLLRVLRVLGHAVHHSN